MQEAVGTTVDIERKDETPFFVDGIGDVFTWIRQNNSTLETNRPQDTDWQALKAEARKSPCE